MWPKFTKLLLGALQVGSTGIPFATWDRSTVPDKPPHVSVGGHWTSVPAICCSTETDRSTVPSGLAVGRFRWQVRQSGMHYLRDPEVTLDIFRRHLKTYLFTLYKMYRMSSALEIFW